MLVDILSVIKVASKTLIKVAHKTKTKPFNSNYEFLINVFQDFLMIKPMTKFKVSTVNK